MQISHQSGVIRKFQRTQWRFQQTFQTPLRSLPSFTETIIQSLGDVESGVVTIDNVVMSVAKLEEFLTQHQLPKEFRHDSSILAETTTELRPLLCAALDCWVDFLFVPSPKSFVLYADHDEYTTFFASSKSNLNAIVQALVVGGFTPIENYARRF